MIRAHRRLRHLASVPVERARPSNGAQPRQTAAHDASDELVKNATSSSQSALRSSCELVLNRYILLTPPRLGARGRGGRVAPTP